MVASASLYIEDLVPGLHYPREEFRYIQDAAERLNHTLDWISTNGFGQGRILEIGLGAVGVRLRMAQAEVDAWDIRSLWNETAERMGIPIQQVNLNDFLADEPVSAPHDLVIFAEVIEHLHQPPTAVLQRIMKAMKPGGLMILTTPNLARLSNRMRLLGGRELFAPFTPESLQMGHVREYTMAEVVQFAEAAGLQVVEREYYCWDMGRFSVLKPLFRLYPALANYLWAVAKKGDVEESHAMADRQ